MLTAVADHLPAYIRASGGVRVRLSTREGCTYASEIAETGGFRIRFPRSADGCEGTLINTGGGLAGGDRTLTDITLDDGAAATFTTQAAEKIYRSDSFDTVIDTRVKMGDTARLRWWPQNTIMFSGARFRRSFEVSMQSTASLIAVETMVFGRAAMGERLHCGAARDRWRVRRGGRLIFADDTAMAGDISATLARPAIGRGARALATILIVDPNAEELLDFVRARLGDTRCEAGASAWSGMLVARLVATDASHVRRLLESILPVVSGASLPRAWQI